MTLLEFLNQQKINQPQVASPFMAPMAAAEPGTTTVIVEGDKDKTSTAGKALKGLAGKDDGGVPGAVSKIGLGLISGILKAKAEEKARQTAINVKESDDKLGAFRNNAANKSASIRQIISGL